MKRRNFINTAGLAGLGLASSSFKSKKANKNLRGTYSQDKNVFSIYTQSKIKPTKIFHITDTHLSLDDDRGEKYQEFSKRMAGAYHTNSHFQTKEEITTRDSFEQTLVLAKEQNADFLALTGDIFSFPSEAAVEWTVQKLKESTIPFAYVAGNHDWHYEGMEGSSNHLREMWTNEHLNPMYQRNHPLFATYDLNGIRFVCIDNSTYEILPEQLDFLKQQIDSNIPFLLLMHIPLFMPGRTIGFGCANPDWSEKSDKNYKIERREKWRKGGHTQTTFSFYDEVFKAPNLLAILAGHTHRPTIDIKNGIPQLVSAHNATGYYSEIKLQTS